MKPFCLLAVLCLCIPVIAEHADDSLAAVMRLTPTQLLLDNENLIPAGICATTEGHSRISRALQNVSENGIVLTVDFGTSYPTLFSLFDALCRTNVPRVTLQTREFGGMNFVAEKRSMAQCTEMDDRVRITALITGEVILIGWGNRRTEVVPLRGSASPMGILRRWLESIAQKCMCSPDRDEIIIAAGSTVQFKQLLAVMYVAYTSGYRNISFTMVRGQPPFTGTTRDFAGYWYEPFTNTLHGFGAGDAGITDADYFKKVITQYHLLGRELTLDEAVEHTAELKISTFPPGAMVYADTSLAGFTNIMPLYCKPGRYTFNLYSGNRSASVGAELTPGSNPLLILRLPDSAAIIPRKGVELPPVWFDFTKNTLHHYGLIAIDNIVATLNRYRAATAEIMLIACDEELQGGEPGHPGDRHSALLEQVLQMKGIAASRIQKSRIRVTKGVCREAIYLMVRGVPEETGK